MDAGEKGLQARLACGGLLGLAAGNAADRSGSVAQLTGECARWGFRSCQWPSGALLFLVRAGRG